MVGFGVVVKNTRCDLDGSVLSKENQITPSVLLRAFYPLKIDKMLKVG